MADETDNLDVSSKLTKEQRDRVEYARLEREEMSRSYDLAKLFTAEIQKQEKTLDKVIKFHTDLSARYKKQLLDIGKQTEVINGIGKAAARYKDELEQQKILVNDQLGLIGRLEKEHSSAMSKRKSMGEALKASYNDINALEEKMIKLQSDKDIFNNLQKRNIEYGKMREDLARDYEKAVLAGLNNEAAAIRIKQNLVNDLIQSTSDEIDRNKGNVVILDQQIDASRKLLKQKRLDAEILEKNIDTQKAIMGQIKFEQEVANRNLKAQEKILVQKMRIYSVTEDALIQEKEKLSVMSAEAERMKAKLNNYEKIQEFLKKQIGYLKTARIVVGEIDNFLGQQSEYYGKTKALIMDIAKGGATAWLSVIKASLDRWIELDRAALEFRRQTGFLVSQTKELDKAAREVNVQMANLGVNIEEAYAAAGALTEEFQVIGLVTKEAIANTAMVSANLGIGVAESAKIKGMFESIAESTGTTGDGLIKSAAALAKMGGVAPRAVMKDIATASGATLSFLAKSPVALMRAAVEARRLGTTVANMSASARGFLNYQDSITSELEASALLGKALNFQEARAAAYAGDVVKSRELALRQIAKAGDFTRLNVYQQEALAKAAGMTVDEIIKQQNQQKLLAKLEATRPELYAKYKAMQDKLRENEKAAAEDLEKQAEEMAKQQLMQGEMNKLTNAFRAIWTDITDALLPIANAIMPILITTVRGLAVVFKVIGGLIRGLFSPIEKFFDSFRSGNKSALKLEEIFAKIGPTVEKITAFAVGLTGTLMHAVTGVATMYAMMIPIVNIFSKLKISIGQAFQPFTVLSEMFTSIATKITNFAGRLSGLSKIFTPFLSMGSSVFKLFGMIAKFAGPIGLVVNIIQFAFSLWKRFSELFASDEFVNAPWYEKIWMGIKAVFGALYDVLIQPFIDLWDWVSDKLMGKSPSKLGLGIVQGIKSIGSMLLNSLTSPFKNAFNLISGIFSGRSGVGAKIVEGLKSVGEFIFDALTWPFKQLIKFASKIPIIGKLFGGGNSDSSIDVVAEAKSKAEGSAIPAVEVKGIPELKESIDKLTDAITKLGGAGGAAAPIVNVNNNPAAMVEKLDELITLLKDGSIGVNIDGIKASKVLARAST